MTKKNKNGFEPGKEVSFEELMKARRQGDKPEQKEPEFNRQAALEQAKAAGINLAGNISNKELKKVIADLENEDAE